MYKVQCGSRTWAVRCFNREFHDQQERYEAIGLPLQRRHLGHHIGCFISEIGSHDQIVHMWGFASMADREARRERMEKDPEWQAFRQLIAGTFSAQENMILRSAPFSPQEIAAPPDAPNK